MTANLWSGRSRSLTSALALLLLMTGAVWAATGRGRPAKIGEYNAADATVEMFAAIDKGDIAVKLIPKDSRQARVMITNKTDKPLNVKLPEAFAGVPVLAQAGLAGGGGGTGRSGGSNGGNQSMGGGMGGMGGMGGGGMGGGMGMFNVPPEKVGQFSVTTVCLEHGKREPQAKVPYEIKPLESFTSKPGVRELCELLGSGRVSQRAAQAAAWHLNNGMTWQELATKRYDLANGTKPPYFSAQEIQNGMQVAATAIRLSEERQKQDSGTSASQSQK